MPSFANIVHINGEWKITGNYMENKHVILRGTLYVNGKKKNMQKVKKNPSPR